MHWTWSRANLPDIASAVAGSASTSAAKSVWLKDLGCSSNAARICRLFLTDDLAFKQGIKTVNGSLPQVLRFVLSHTGMKAGLADRFRTLVSVFVKSGEIAHELVETRCQRGAEIARKMRFSEAVAQGIQNLDEHWDGGGQPLNLVGDAIPIYSRIALLSQVIDVFQVANGVEAATLAVAERSGTWFDPELAAAFKRVTAQPHFWDMLRSPKLQQAIFALEPAQQSSLVDEDYLDDISEAFAQVVDSKSPYTSGHSERVTIFTDLIAEQMGVSADRRRWLKRAALLHDIGKLGVSNSVLDKQASSTRTNGRRCRSTRPIRRRSCRVSPHSAILHRSPALTTNAWTAKVIRAA
jgi:hypothetical protein